MTDLQHAEIVALLTEIRDSFREFVQVMTAPVDETPPPCTHPPERRTDGRAGAPFWKCHDCGYVFDNERVET